jgi:hypothetical protein
VPDSAVSQPTDEWAGVVAAITAALALNQDLPGALIVTPADFGALLSETGALSGLWLGSPPPLAGMRILPTSSMTAGHAVLGDFSKGVALAVWSDLTLEVNRWAKPTYGSHVMAAWARMAFYVLQPNALFEQLDTVTP